MYGSCYNEVRNINKTNKNKIKYHVGFLNWFTKEFGVIFFLGKITVKSNLFQTEGKE